ncbi:hypothetical protein [Vibrio phage VP4B]|uniref:Uncharacterized protein n=1 Tax=Vibrio phage VP4B TaxID=1262540 RepID=V9M002_9CAUD|nr:hypothetical protein FDJ61_gp052 [Vibrio phage VP4B]AGB07166.1 hypothetical protein [Vibrio phage VP4B]
MSEDLKPGDPIELTIKRDDGLPDSTVMTKPDGTWELEVTPVGSPGKVTFTVHHGIRKLGEHAISFSGMPFSAEILSGAYPIMPFDEDRVVTYQLKDKDGNNYHPGEGEFLSIRTTEASYENLDIPIPSTGIVEIPWGKTSLGKESHVLKNSNDEVLNQYDNEYIVVDSSTIVYQGSSPKLGESWMTFGMLTDLNGNAIPNAPARIHSLTNGYEFDQTMVTDENGIIPILLDPPAGTDEFDLELEILSGGTEETSDITWSEDNTSSKGTVVLDPTPAEISEDDTMVFKGIIKDNNGDGIPNAPYDVYRKDATGEIYHDDRYTADEQGHFTIDFWLEVGNLAIYVATGEHYQHRNLTVYGEPGIDQIGSGTTRIAYGKDFPVYMYCNDKYGKPAVGKTVSFKYVDHQGGQTEVAGTADTDEFGLVNWTIPWEKVQAYHSLRGEIEEDYATFIFEAAPENVVVPESVEIIVKPTKLHPYQPGTIAGFVMGSDGKPVTERTNLYGNYNNFNGSIYITTDEDGYFESRLGSAQSEHEQGYSFYFGRGIELTRVDVAWTDGEGPLYEIFRFDYPNYPNGIGLSETITLTGKMVNQAWLAARDKVVPMELTVKVMKGAELISTHKTVCEDTGVFSVDINTPDTGDKFDVWLSTPDGSHQDRLRIWIGPERIKKIIITEPTPSSVPQGSSSITVGCQYLDENGQGIANARITIYGIDPFNGGWGYAGSGRTDSEGKMTTNVYVRGQDVLKLRFMDDRTETFIDIPFE